MLKYKNCDKGTPFSRFVVAWNVWAVITETVRNPIFVASHQMLLINQRCRPSIKCQMCFFFPCCLWMLVNATIGINQHSHTHTLSLSLSLRYLAFFPHHFLPFISRLCSCVCINWNTDFTAFGRSHFLRLHKKIYCLFCKPAGLMWNRTYVQKGLNKGIYAFT